MTTIAVAGSIAQRPGYGGHAWALLQYAFGLRRLGLDVLFIDQLGPEMTGGMAPWDSAPRERECLKWFDRVMREAGLAESCALVRPGEKHDIGLSRRELLHRLAEAECLFNIGGFITDRDILDAAKCRVFLDIDPGFLQMWRDLNLADALRGHDRYVTVAQNIQMADCRIPTCGLDWLTIAPPVDLDSWRVQNGGQAFTTVASWRGPYDPVEYGGRVYGLRAHEFRKFAQLPRLARGHRFEAALDIDDADHSDAELLQLGGWELVDPARHAGTLESYRRYVAKSSAEVMVAKQIYVETRSGWFSDRSACYLASGKPVLAQDTGFSRVYPVGEGLLPFSDLDEAADGVREICNNYRAHARAAREIAAAHFDARKVLSRLLAQLGVDAV